MFHDVRPGIYRVEVERAGYVDAAATTGAGRLERVPPSSGTRLLIGLVRAVAISGQVTDEGGRPVSGMAVSATRRVEAKGQVRFISAGMHSLTDDSGRYRLHHLPPGSYTVTVSPGGDEAATRFRGPIYYPGQSDPSRAEFVDLNAGDEVSPIDVRVSTQSPGSVSGVVTNAPDEWQRGRPAVAIVPVSGVRAPIAYVYPDSSGKFLVENVPPGEYHAIAWGPIRGGDFSIAPEGAATRYSSSPITVRTGEATEVSLALAPGIRVEARFALGAGTSGCSGLSSLELHSDSEWPQEWTLTEERTRERVIWEHLPPGAYRFEMTQLEHSCTFVGVQITGTNEPPRKVVAVGSSIVLAAAIIASRGAVSGNVTEHGRPVRGAIVGLWAAHDGAISAVTETDANGSFEFDRLPPGTYHLVPLTAQGPK